MPVMWYMDRSEVPNPMTINQRASMRASRAPTSGMTSGLGIAGHPASCSGGREASYCELPAFRRHRLSAVMLLAGEGEAGGFEERSSMTRLSNTAGNLQGALNE